MSMASSGLRKPLSLPDSHLENDMSTAMIVQQASREDAMAIIARHTAESSSGCWEWKSSKRCGYGQLTFRGKHYAAHRFVFEAMVGRIADDNWVLHHCDNRSCVNPAHLYQGTPIDNRADMLDRSRWQHPWGQRSHCANGHAYADVGYRICKSDGSRVCRECQKNYKRDQRAKLKGESK